MKEPEDRRTFQRSPYPPVRRASAETRGLRSLTGHRLRSSFRVITLKNRASGPSFDAADILRTGGLFGIKGRGLFSCPFSNFYFPFSTSPPLARRSTAKPKTPSPNADPSSRPSTGHPPRAAPSTHPAIFPSKSSAHSESPIPPAPAASPKPSPPANRSSPRALPKLQSISGTSTPSPQASAPALRPRAATVRKTPA